MNTVNQNQDQNRTINNQVTRDFRESSFMEDKLHL